MFDEALSETIGLNPVIAVLVVDDASSAVPLAKALLDGGIKVIELTLRTPAALDAAGQIRVSVPDVIVGLGTVLTPQQVADGKAAGAAFAVAPGLNQTVLNAARDHGLSFAPGVMTPSDIELALEHGCRLMKFFPAETSGGLRHLRSMAGPYKHMNIRFIPLGGLNADNMSDYLGDPLVHAIGGSWIAPRDLIQAQDWQAISERAATAVAAAADVGQGS
jgi:2-dehydro-3-deoxyphosphogluconate aldolase/(4S)-4-hydroxy-2-oxoglutarate aldolase